MASLSDECRERASYLLAMAPEGLSTLERQCMETLFKAAEHTSKLAPIPADTILLEIIGHLGAAISQTLPSDDQRIAEHVRAAHELARMLRKAA